MTKDELKSIFISRPFKTRNADEYDLENVLDLFIDPTDGLVGPFDFSNSIIKGKMGSGKTIEEEAVLRRRYEQEIESSRDKLAIFELLTRGCGKKIVCTLQC